MEAREEKVVSRRPQPTVEKAWTREPVGKAAEAVAKDAGVRADRPVAAERHWHTSRSA